MSWSFDDLTKPVTKEEAQQSIYDALHTMGVTTTAWKPGAVVRTVIVIFAILYAALTTVTASIARSGFLELSTGSWLTLVARYVYSVERIPATFATGFVALSNTGGGVFVEAAEDVIVRNVTTGKLYRNVAPFTLSGGQTLVIAVRAAEAGADSSAAPGAIGALETTLLGVTVTNAAAVLGRDEESDPELRSRCLAKLGSLSPFGPWDAYDYAARSATRPDGSAIGVTRVRVTKDGFGGVQTYITTATGAVSPTDVAIVDDAIQRAAAPLSVTADVFSAGVALIPVTYTVWIYNTSGLTEAQIQDAIAAKLAIFMAAQPIGGNTLPGDTGKVFADAIRTVVGSALPRIFRATVAAPAADITLAISDAPMLGTVTGTVIQVAPPEAGVP